jgi:hypothetical protein
MNFVPKADISCPANDSNGFGNKKFLINKLNSETMPYN